MNIKGNLRKITELSIGIAAVALLALAGCGGGGTSGNNNGGGGNGGEYNGSNVPSPSGAVSANFVSNGNTPKFILAKSGRQIIGGSAANFVQSSGVVTTLDNYTFSGSPAVTQDVAGDANFAMGRWAWGTVSDTSTNPSTVLGTMDASYAADYFTWHYLLVNNASAWPSNVTMSCDNGVFTKPTMDGGFTTTPSATAHTTGSLATLSFATAVGTKSTLGFTLTTTDGGATNTVSFSSLDLPVGSMTLVHDNGPKTSDTWILLSDGGGGAIRINGLYSIVLPNGNSYQGVFSFKCQ